MENRDMKSFFRYVLVVCSLFVCGASFASNVAGYAVPTVEPKYGEMGVAQLWEMGNTAYANSDFLAAEKAYNEILGRDMHSVELYYNLGNLYHRRGNLGLSLLYLYRAQKMNPSDRDITHNIDVVKAGAVDEIEELPTLFITKGVNWLASRFSGFGWSVASLAMLAVALLMVMLYIFSPGIVVRRVGFSFAALFALLFVVATIFALEARSNAMNSTEAVVLSRRSVVRSSPDSSATEIFVIHEGTKMSIEREFGDWCEIRIGDGKQGWIELSSIGKI